MFGHRYWGDNYYGQRYWGDGGTAGGGGGGDTTRRPDSWADRGGLVMGVMRVLLLGVLGLLTGA